MDEVTIALLEASRKLILPKQSTNGTSSSCSNIPGLTLSAPQATSPISSPGVSPNSSFTSGSIATSPTSPSFLHSWFGGIQRNRAFSESHISSGATVKVDLSPWLAEGNNARELKVARERKNSSKKMEEAMAGGLSSADMYMPPM
eukprot:GFUD01015473.1.p1 GENE.GFUD01015473.1~~GFUD01015473.1.p1  ORF type:complete len:145 (+),score=45.53 GFUD01015473.1:71-505(+)